MNSVTGMTPEQIAHDIWQNFGNGEAGIPAFEDSDVKQALTKQICSSVQWVKAIERMIELGVDCFIEIGPKNSLQKLVKQIYPEARVFSVDSKESIKLMLGELNG